MLNPDTLERVSIHRIPLFLGIVKNIFRKDGIFMDELRIQNVNVLGDNIVAAQDKDGQIWAGVSFFCKALGMTNKQRDNQVAKVQSDKTLSKGTLKFREGVFDPNNEAVAIRVDFIPLWLAKMQVTGRMEKEHPELADKLLEYQLKAKDILAAAFLPNQNGDSAILRQQIQTIAKGTEELYQMVDTVDGKVDSVREDLETLKNDMPVFIKDAKDIQDALKKKATQALGGYGSAAYKDNSTRGYVFADIQKELRRQFDVKRYDQIRHKDVPAAMKIIAEYKLPLALKNRVDMANAQQSLDV